MLIGTKKVSMNTKKVRFIANFVLVPFLLVRFLCKKSKDIFFNAFFCHLVFFVIQWFLSFNAN